MPQPERGSLMNLPRRPLPKASAPLVSDETEKQVLGREDYPQSARRVHSDSTDANNPESVQESAQAPTTANGMIRQNMLPNTLLPRKRREVMVSRSYRLPLSLATQLEEVCRENDYVINDVVIQAITRQLSSLTKQG